MNRLQSILRDSQRSLYKHLLCFVSWGNWKKVFSKREGANLLCLRPWMLPVSYLQGLGRLLWERTDDFQERGLPTSPTRLEDLCQAPQRPRWCIRQLFWLRHPGRGEGGLLRLTIHVSGGQRCRWRGQLKSALALAIRHQGGNPCFVTSSSEMSEMRKNGQG